MYFILIRENLGPKSFFQIAMLCQRPIKDFITDLEAIISSDNRFTIHNSRCIEIEIFKLVSSTYSFLKHTASLAHFTLFSLITIRFEFFYLVCKDKILLSDLLLLTHLVLWQCVIFYQTSA